MKASAWVIPGTPTLRPLVPLVRVERGYWSTFFRVRVRPVCDLVVVVS